MITVNDVLLAMGNEAKMIENGLPVYYVQSTMLRALGVAVGNYDVEGLFAQCHKMAVPQRNVTQETYFEYEIAVENMKKANNLYATFGPDRSAIVDSLIRYASTRM